MLKLKIKAFIHGFDYAVKNYDKIEDRHFHTLPGASWHDSSTQKFYRKSIAFGRKYMQYRYEVLTAFVLFVTILLFMFTW